MKNSRPKKHFHAKRWFEEKVIWPILDARDFVLRRGPVAKKKALPHETFMMKMRRRALDRWDFTLYSMRRCLMCRG